MPDSLPKPVYLERLKVENIRSFESVEVEFAVPESGGQWIVFLGDNGSGKSTLLQLIGLCHTGAYPNPFSTDLRWANSLVRLGSQVGSFSQSLRSSNYVRANENIKVTFLFELRLHLEESIEHAEPIFESSLQGIGRLEQDVYPSLMGFGTKRSDGEKSTLPKKGYDLLASLFDSESMPSRGPIEPEKWLIGERLRTVDSPDRLPLYETLVTTLKLLLPRVEEVIVLGEGVFLKFEENEDGSAPRLIPFASVSQGYRSTITWMIDLLAGWLHTQTEENIKQWASEGKLLEAMTGIVLVDELDLHLHPTWQREIVPTLRRLFPNLTFIVTTHSPLIVQSAQDCEVFVVERPSASSPSTVRKVELGASTVDKILTSSAFSLETQLDPATSAKIAHARDLLEQGETPDLQSLTNRLDEASGLVDQQVEALSELPWAEARELIRARIEAKKRG